MFPSDGRYQAAPDREARQTRKGSRAAAPGTGAVAVRGLSGAAPRAPGGVCGHPPMNTWRLRLAVSRLAAGQRGACLVGECDGDEPLLQGGMRRRARGHKEPALQQAAGLDEPGVDAVREILVWEA